MKNYLTTFQIAKQYIVCETTLELTGPTTSQKYVAYTYYPLGDPLKL